MNRGVAMSEYFDKIMKGLEDVKAYRDGDKTKGKSRIRTLTEPMRPPKTYSKEEVRQVRTRAELSQKSFADFLGVSVRTVETWESGNSKPAGSSSRLIEMLENDRSVINTFIVSDNR